MAGARSIICDTFSSSVMRPTRSAASRPEVLSAGALGTLGGEGPVHHLRHLLLERHAADQIRRAPLECLSRGARGDCGCEQDGEAERTARHRFLRGGIALAANERQNDLMTLLWRPLVLVLSASGLIPGATLAQSDHAD